MHLRYLSYCFTALFTLLFLIACDSEKPITAVDQPEKIKLDLSLDNISTEKESNNNEPLIEKNSALFEKLSDNKTEAEISVSGKLYTDKTKDKDYLKSVDGAQINIQGNFE